MSPLDGIPQLTAPTPERHELEEAADGFEALLWGEVLKTMRRSVGGEESFARGVYTSMFDEELARILAERTSGLDRELARQFGAEPLPEAAQSLLDGPGWVPPVSGRVHRLGSLQRFGAERPGHEHRGLDLARPEGTEVRAARAGTVRRLNRDPEASGGVWLEIDHGAGVSSRYLHLREVRDGLRVGEKLAAGEAIGTVGNTGPESHGAHLHFEIRVDTGSKRAAVDPEPLLKKWSRGDFFPKGATDPVDARIETRVWGAQR